MRALLYKDINTLGGNMITYTMLTVIVAGMAFFGYYSILLGLVAMLLIAEVSLGAWSMDIKSRWNKYCDVLPFSRQKVINEKFTLIIINSLISLFLTEACSVIGNSVRGEQLFGLNNALMLLSFFVVSALIAIGLMIMILVNYVAALILLGCLAGFLGSMSTYIISENSFFAVEAVGELSFLNNPVFYISIALLCLIIFIVAWVVTLSVYKRKEA